MRTTILLTLLLTLAGCSSMIPGADKVVFTKNPDDIVGCKIVGRTAWNPDQKKSTTNQVVLQGGDTVFITHTSFAKDGVIYNCHGNDPRQPIPVQIQ